MRIGEGTIRIKRKKKREKRSKRRKRRRRKKNDDAAGREPARLARQVQRARMQRYEATNSHNYTWIAKLRPDFDMFRAREETHFPAIGIPGYGCFCELHRDRWEIHRLCAVIHVKLIFMEIKHRKMFPSFFGSLNQIALQSAARYEFLNWISSWRIVVFSWKSYGARGNAVTNIKFAYNLIWGCIIRKDIISPHLQEHPS